MQNRRATFLIVDEDDLDAEALIDGRRVGYAWCVREGERLKVSDLHVDDGHRHQGIGGRLLRIVLAAVDAANVREVWGIVTADDLARWPELLDWYRRHGFHVTDPDEDGEDVPGAVKKIVRGGSVNNAQEPATGD